MTDWLASMQQTFEYYVVDPGTWLDVKALTNVKSCTINWDSEAETLGSATIDTTESIGECYVRAYLVTLQNGVRNRYSLGTFLVQSPSFSFNGKHQDYSLDAYTPLLELKENPPPLGYSLFKGDNIMEKASMLVGEHARAPVVKTEDDKTLDADFVSNTNDTWITFIADLIANAEYTFMLDELGRILFSPKQDTASLQPVWTYTDDNSSILYPDVSVDRDLYGIPNTVEVVYNDPDTGTPYVGNAVNDDVNSPISTINRGREIIHRVTNPNLPGVPADPDERTRYLNKYAERVLRELSTLEFTISYSHGYCPVRLGDCVRLNYKRAGITDVKAKVISQSIKCEPGCPVSEKAVFTTKLWGDK